MRTDHAITSSEPSVPESKEHRNAAWPLLSILVVMLLLALLISAGVGSVAISPESVLGALGLGTPVDETTRAIILQIRLPRILLAVVVGAGLATSGTVFQGIFRNPMADPYIIGVSAGAALGATAAIVLRLTFAVLGISAVTLSAFVGALLVTMLVYRLARFRNDVMVEHLLLAGVAVSAFLAAIISALQLLGGESLQQVIFWLMGGFSGRTWDHVLLTAPYVIVGFAVAQVLGRDLNILMLGDETARSLGVATTRVRSILIAAGALVAAAAVSVSGLIGFVGLIVPHLIRIIVGPDHRSVLPAAALAGAITLLLADTVARSIAAPMEVPVGIVTAALGAPFFLYLLRRQRRRSYWI